MKSYTELNQFLGYYIRNSDFQAFLKKHLKQVPRFDSGSNYMCDKKSKLELGLTNEQSIKNEDLDKIDSQFVFTHYVIYKQTMNLIGELPFGVKIGDEQTTTREKAGAPNHCQKYTFFDEDRITDRYDRDGVKIFLDFEPKKLQLRHIMIQQLEPNIVAESKPKLAPSNQNSNSINDFTSLIKQIQQFNDDGFSSEAEQTTFFDKIGDYLSDSPSLSKKEKKNLLEALLAYQKKNDQINFVNWSFIHLIEFVDEPDYSIYDQVLLDSFNSFASTTTVLLLNRSINDQEGENRKK